MLEGADVPNNTAKTSSSIEIERELSRLFERIDSAEEAEQRAHHLADRIVRERTPVEGVEAALAAAAEVRAVALEARGLRAAMEREALELRSRRAREASLVASRERALKASRASARERRVDDAALREAIQRRRDSYPSRRQLYACLCDLGLEFGSDRFKRACDDLGVLMPQTKKPRT